MNDTATETRSAAADTTGFRMLHTMVRVKDLDKSLDFYTRLLGMKLLRKKDFPGGKFTLAFVGYGDESDTAVIELTHNWDQEEAYDLGNGYGHVAIGVPDIYATCEALEKEGANIPRPPGPMKHSTTVIAFVEDPDGYKIELIERA
jgi:lactoylglutathione lyase